MKWEVPEQLILLVERGETCVLFPASRAVTYERGTAFSQGDANVSRKFVEEKQSATIAVGGGVTEPVVRTVRRPSLIQEEN